MEIIVSGVHDLEQKAKLWLADLIDNLDVLKNADSETTMDITVHGVTFEFRLKPVKKKHRINQP